jgi:type I restriction enzyme S subunit
MNKETKKGVVPKFRFKEFSDAWDVENFKDLTDVLRCGIASTPIYVENGVPFLSAQNVNSEGELVLNKYNFISEEFYKELSKKHELKKGDLLYSRVGAGFGNAAVFELEGNYGVYVSLTHIRPSKKLDNYFLKFLLNCDVGQKQADVGVVKGGGVPNLNVKVVEKFRIPFPSLPEQTKIAVCLSSLDDLITAQTQKIEALKTHKKGLMQQLFPQEGETVPKLRFSEFMDDWKETTLGKICEYWNGGSHEGGITENGEYYLISLNSLNIDGNLKSDMKRISYTDNSLQKNDMVMVLSDVAHGNFLGLTDVIPNNSFVLNQRMAGLRLKNPDQDSVSFLRSFINFNQKYFKLKGQGSSPLNLSKSSVIDFPILLPSPIEQQKIADCLSSLDELINAQVKKLDALKLHKKGLMQGLFPSSNE